MEARLRLQDFNDLPTSSPADKPRHSWTPQSLIALSANPPAPPTIGNILYPGKRTLLSGETESLKTWLALILAKAEMELGIPVAWVDLDDMGAGALLHRLRALNVPDQQINDHFLYYQPDQRLKGDLLTDVLLQLTVSGTRLMIIDAFNPALNLHGLDPNSTPDIETFWREIADPIAKTGTAPCLLDHVAKNAESRGKYAYGSERKASGATVHIGTHSLTALAIGTTGRTLLTTHKDRPGYLPRPTIGILELASDGAEIEYKLERDRSHDTGAFRPTVLMEKISRRLEQEQEARAMNWVEDNAKGKSKDAIGLAVTLLRDEGHIQETPGPRNSRLFTSLNTYREADEPEPGDLPATSPDLPPNLGPFGVSTTSPPPPLSKGGEVGEIHDAKPGELPRPPRPPARNGRQADIPFELLFDTQPDPEEGEA